MEQEWSFLLLIFQKNKLKKLGARKSTLSPFLKYTTSLPDNVAKYASKSGREVGGGAIAILKIMVELKSLFCSFSIFFSAFKNFI